MSQPTVTGIGATNPTVYSHDLATARVTITLDLSIPELHQIYFATEDKEMFWVQAAKDLQGEDRERTLSRAAAARAALYAIAAAMGWPEPEMQQ